MNQYGTMAERYFRQSRPVAYAAIGDKDTFFTNLGEQVADQVDELATRLAGPDSPGEGYLEKVGRLNVARLQAQEKVLADLVYLPAELVLDNPREDLHEVLADLPTVDAMIGSVQEWEERVADDSTDSIVSWREETLLPVYRRLIPIIRPLGNAEAIDAMSVEEVAGLVAVLMPYRNAAEYRMKTAEELEAAGLVGLSGPTA